MNRTFSVTCKWMEEFQVERLCEGVSGIYDGVVMFVITDLVSARLSVMHSLNGSCKNSCQNKGGAKLKVVQNFFLVDTKSLAVWLIFLLFDCIKMKLKLCFAPRVFISPPPLFLCSFQCDEMNSVNSISLYNILTLRV